MGIGGRKMNKYIIKNCPAITKSTVCVNDKYSNLCKDITDCVMKRIVELCDTNVSKVLYDGENIKLIKGNDLAVEILELLEIEECE